MASKTRHASDLKRKLGITVWKEITDDMNQGIKNVKESSVYVMTRLHLFILYISVNFHLHHIMYIFLFCFIILFYFLSFQSVEQSVGNFSKAVHDAPM